MIRQGIEQAVKEALVALGADEAAFVVERPGSLEYGDYATNAALVAAKTLKKNPKEIKTPNKKVINAPKKANEATWLGVKSR